MRNKLKKAAALALVCLMLLGAAAVPAGAAGVTRVSCTMYGNGASGRGFCWFTAEKSGSDLQLIKTADYTGGFNGAKTYTGAQKLYRGRYSHQVAVTDLEPGTAYTYRVGDAAADVWSEPCTFVTDDADDAFSFIVIADVQASSDENFAHAALTMKAALHTLPGAEFAVNLGDYVNDNTNDEWDWYFSNFAFANNALTQVPVAGNHDGNITNKANTNCFRNMFCLDRSANRSIEGVYYSFDFGNMHVAVLNTNDMYPMSQAQRNWLVNDMTGSDALWKVVLMHRSLYSAGKNINKPDTVVMRNELLPVFDELGLDLVFAGHDHMYLRTAPLRGDARVEDVTYVTEIQNGEETEFAVDPAGTVYALPSTAGTKRYAVNENAMPPILDTAEACFSTRELGGCFVTVEISGGRLIYKAYTVDDDTQEIAQVDSFGILKSAAGSADAKRLDQSFFSTLVSFGFNFAKAFVKMLVSYIRLLAAVTK